MLVRFTGTTTVGCTVLVVGTFLRGAIEKITRKSEKPKKQKPETREATISEPGWEERQKCPLYLYLQSVC